MTKRTFDKVACPRGVAPEDHERQGCTDVCYVEGALGDYAAIACVTDEALVSIPRHFYVHPLQVNAEG